MPSEPDPVESIVVIWRRYTDWLRAYMPLAYDNLAPGATDAQLAEVTTVVGHELPADVQALLRVTNGQRSTTSAGTASRVPAFPQTYLLSTDSIIAEWRRWASTADGFEHQRTGRSLMPAAIKPRYARPHWIPLLGAAARADYFGADFDPEPAGAAGQIINFGRDEETHYVAAPPSPHSCRS